jgi:SWI/SNF-related matrix-associated actin-dependent regulator of chromatin subfamily D
MEQFQIFGLEPVIFQKLPEIVNRYLAAPDPIILHYNLNPAVPPPDRPSAWDVELKIEDSALKNRMAVTVNTSKESAQTLLKLDEEVCFILLMLDKTGLLITILSYFANQIALLAQSLHNSQMKRTFLESFAKDPSQFIQKWLESQSRDLESILGNGPMEGLTIRQEELRRSEFFQLPWVEEVRYKCFYIYKNCVN